MKELQELASTRRASGGETTTLADEISRVLVELGIEYVIELPGGPAMPLLRALHQQPELTCVSSATEAGAVLVAEGYFRVTRRPAAVVVTSGPGALNTVPALGLALREQSAVLVISAQVPGTSLGRGAAQEFDTVSALRPVCKQSVQFEDVHRAAETLNDLVGVICSGRQGPGHVSGKADDWLRPTRRGRKCSPFKEFRQVDGDGIAACESALTSARRPIVLLGYGALLSGASAAAIELAKLLPRARFACSPRAKGLFPELHPQSLGVFGFAAREETMAAVGASDLVLVVGSRLGEITTAGWTPALEGKRMIQIDAYPGELGRVYPIELGLAGDARAVLAGLCDAVRRRNEKGLLREAG